MINTKTTISISEARKRIFDIADEVQAPNKVYTLTADGKPKVVIMSAEEYESWMETMEVLYDFPDIKQDIAETKEAFRTGEYKNWTTLEELEREWGVGTVVAEKANKKYGIRTDSKTKGKKGSK